MSRLSGVSAKHGLPSLADTLGLLGAFVASELEGMERELNTLPRRDDLVGQSAAHLMSLGGKRIRPLCVALSGRMGQPDPMVLRKLAGAVELVHSATLLHDDVVDQGTLRRGKPTACALYGNAASVFGGDWLLIEALRRVRQAGVPGLLDRLLDIIDEMIQAESIQLERRGQIAADEATYFRVIEGKTAALFRWAMVAGGRAGGLDDDACAALERYGNHLGVAFQIVDDALDIDGAPREMGKALFTDLREGKMTYPLIVGMSRDPKLVGLLEEAVLGSGDVPPSVGEQLLGSLRASGAIDAAHDKAREHAELGAAALNGLPEGKARSALEAVALVAANRRA
ncbi:MAG: polyprenyl synthetase family protein [Myxococcota bacterium]